MSAQVQAVLKPPEQAVEDSPGVVWDPLTAALAFAYKFQQTHEPHENTVRSCHRNFPADLQLAIEFLQKVTGATGAAFAEARNQEIVCIARSGTAAPGLGASQNRGSSADCIRTGEVLLCQDAETYGWVNRQVCHQLGVRSFVLVPVREGLAVMGVLGIFADSPQRFDSSDVDATRWAASMLAKLLRAPGWPTSPLAAKTDPTQLQPERKTDAEARQSASRIVDNPSQSTFKTLFPGTRDLAKGRLPARTVLVLFAIVAILGVATGIYVLVHRPQAGFNSPSTVDAARTVVGGASVRRPAMGIASEHATPGSLPPRSQQELTNMRTIRHSFETEYTVVTIETDAAVAYQVHTSPTPHRVYLDLKNTRMRDSIPVNTQPGDSRLRRIRVSQFSPSAARVVLDLQKPVAYSVERRSHPARLVVKLTAMATGQ